MSTVRRMMMTMTGMTMSVFSQLICDKLLTWPMQYWPIINDIIIDCNYWYSYCIINDSNYYSDDVALMIVVAMVFFCIEEGDGGDSFWRVLLKYCDWKYTTNCWPIWKWRTSQYEAMAIMTNEVILILYWRPVANIQWNDIGGGNEISMMMAMTGNNNNGNRKAMMNNNVWNNQWQ